MRASTIRFFSFSFAAPASREAVAGVYHSLFLFFLRHSDTPGSRCGRLPFAFSLFPSPLRLARKPLRASTIRFFSFSFAALASRSSSMTDSSLPGKQYTGQAVYPASSMTDSGIPGKRYTWQRYRPCRTEITSVCLSYLLAISLSARRFFHTSRTGTPDQSKSAHRCLR